MKICNRCNLQKPFTEYYKNKTNKFGDGLFTICKSCVIENSSKYQKDNIEEIRTKRRIKRENNPKYTGPKNWSKNEKYNGKNLTYEQYKQLCLEQNNLCLICKMPDDKRSLSVDHNHRTNEIRGLLCHRCNSGLGFFKDNPETLKAAAAYLTERGFYCN